MTTAMSSAREPRTAISLRLPPSLINTVEQYATEHRLSKTDAFLHFLSKGIEAEKSDSAADALARIEQKVSETLRLVRGRTETTSDKRSVIDAVSSTCNDFPAIRRAYLFGSFARGTFSDESDVDIRLELDPSARFSLRDLEHFSKQVEEKTRRSTDVITAHTIKNVALREAIDRDKELIYDREAK